MVPPHTATTTMPRRSHTALDPPGAIEVSDDEVISIEDSDAVEEHDPSAGSQGSNSFSNNINVNDPIA